MCPRDPNVMARPRKKILKRHIYGEFASDQHHLCVSCSIDSLTNCSCFVVHTPHPGWKGFMVTHASTQKTKPGLGMNQHNGHVLSESLSLSLSLFFSRKAPHGMGLRIDGGGGVACQTDERHPPSWNPLGR